MLRKSLIVGAFVMLSTAAFAKNDGMQATLVTATQPKDALAGSIAWRCKDTTCFSVSAVNQTELSACRALVKSFGAVSSFSSSYGKFDDAKLQKCNESASKR